MDQIHTKMRNLTLSDDLRCELCSSLPLIEISVLHLQGSDMHWGMAAAVV